MFHGAVRGPLRPAQTKSMPDPGYGLPRTHLLRLSEDSRTRLQRALAGRKRATFRSISPSVYCQSHARSVAHTPFRTVSEGVFSEVRSNFSATSQQHSRRMNL